MARAVITILLGGALGASACSKGQIRSGETAFCSTDSSDDPQYICDPGMDLICINTYAIPVTDPREMRKWDGGIRPVYVCRLACEKTEDCPIVGDVCCPGTIHGKTYGKDKGCTPETLCPPLLGGGDAGAVDRPPSPPRPDATPDTTPDVTADAPADSPRSDAAAAGDAGVDAAQVDAL